MTVHHFNKVHILLSFWLRIRNLLYCRSCSLYHFIPSSSVIKWQSWKVSEDYLIQFWVSNWLHHISKPHQMNRSIYYPLDYDYQSREYITPVVLKLCTATTHLIFHLLSYHKQIRNGKQTGSHRNCGSKPEIASGYFHKTFWGWLKPMEWVAGTT